MTDPTGTGITAELHDEALQVLAIAHGADPELTLTRSVAGEELLFLTVDRDDMGATGFTALWESPVSYLMLDRPISLYVDDESGVDAGGADEVQLKVLIDNEAIFDDSWDDADTGERWPGLAERIVATAAVRLPGVRRVGFVGSIDLSYVEEDIVAAGFRFASAAGVGPGEPKDPVTRRISLPVPDTIKDGRYSFTCSITRHPF